jgi:ribonuclease D
VIDTTNDLAAVLPALRAAPWLAVDTEADSLHAYPEKLCLIQISFPGADLLIDPLASLDLAPLWQTLAGRELIFHGADYDLRLLRRGPGFVPARVFDTMLAARLVGIKQFSLGDLVQHFLGITLEKSAQKANWALRPLSPRMLAYAENDTRHLKPVADALRHQLIALDRLAWHEQACAQLVADCAQPRVTNHDEAWRLKGADRLSRRGLAVLRELWRWREHEAVSANRPPFFVIAHDKLLALAREASEGRGVDGLVPPRLSPHRRHGLHRAIERALALTEEHWPLPHRHHNGRFTLAQRKRLEELHARRDQHAARLNLDPTLIASRATLSLLAQDWDTHAKDLLPWQRQLLEAATPQG